MGAELAPAAPAAKEISLPASSGAPSTNTLATVSAPVESTGRGDPTSSKLAWLDDHLQRGSSPTKESPGPTTGRNTFVDSSNPRGLDENLAVKQGEMGNCHLLGGIYSLSTTARGDELLGKMVDTTPRGNHIVTFPSGERAEVTGEDLNHPTVSKSPPGVRAIEVADAKIRAERHPEKGHHWSVYANNGGVQSLTLTQLTGNRSDGMNPQNVPAEARERFISDWADAFKANRENIAATANMVSSDILDENGVKYSTVAVHGTGKKERFAVQLADGTTQVYSHKDLRKAGMTTPPSGSGLVELTEERRANGKLERGSAPSLDEAEDVRRILPSGFTHVFGHTFSVVDADTTNRTIRVVNPWDTSRVFDIPYKEFGDSFGGVAWAPLSADSGQGPKLPDQWAWTRENGVKPRFTGGK